MQTWRPLQWILFGLPMRKWSRHTSLEDRVPTNFIWVFPFSWWNAMTWQWGQGTRLIVGVLAASPLNTLRQEQNAWYIGGTLMHYSNTNLSIFCSHDLTQNINNHGMYVGMGNSAVIGSDNGPSQRQAINWNNAGILLNGPMVQILEKSESIYNSFHSRNSIWKLRKLNGGSFVMGSMG